MLIVNNCVFHPESLCQCIIGGVPRGPIATPGVGPTYPINQVETLTTFSLANTHKLLEEVSQRLKTVEYKLNIIEDRFINPTNKPIINNFRGETCSNIKHVLNPETSYCEECL
jgi:hypothetical protein